MNEPGSVELKLIHMEDVVSKEVSGYGIHIYLMGK